MTEMDDYWMREALKAAETAGNLDEVPIGACLVDQDGNILATAGNRTIIDSDPTAHAEILVLRAAARKINNYRLVESTIYTTIEPCAMCAGALVNARVKRLVYGARDERFGAVRTHFNICDSELLNHRIEIVAGVLEDECRRVVQDFFRKKRNFQKSQKIIANST